MGWCVAGEIGREAGNIMATFYMFFGAQAYEFERPEIVAKPGAKLEIVATKYTLIIKPSTTKVVIKK